MASSGGRGGVHFSNKNWEGGYNFYHKIFWGGSVLKHYTFLKTTVPPWDVINDRSLNELKSTHKTKVTCTCQLTLRSISRCLGQNNLKIINLFYKRLQEHQTNFQIMLKYYISLGSNRDLG